jgi:hypothetical protein
VMTTGCLTPLALSALARAPAVCVGVGLWGNQRGSFGQKTSFCPSRGDCLSCTPDGRVPWKCVSTNYELKQKSDK